MSIAADIIPEDEPEENQTERKKKFLEKRKTYEYHEYPVQPLPAEINEGLEEEENWNELKENI